MPTLGNWEWKCDGLMQSSLFSLSVPYNTIVCFWFQNSPATELSHSHSSLSMLKQESRLYNTFCFDVGYYLLLLQINKRVWRMNEHFCLKRKLSTGFHCYPFSGFGDTSVELNKNHLYMGQYHGPYLMFLSRSLLNVKNLRGTCIPSLTLIRLVVLAKWWRTCQLVSGIWLLYQTLCQTKSQTKLCQRPFNCHSFIEGD